MALWPEVEKRAERSSIKRDSEGEVCSVHGIMNYQPVDVERTLLPKGLIYSKRDGSGADEEMVGVQWEATEVVVRNARLLSAGAELDAQGFDLRQRSTSMSYEDFFGDKVVDEFYADCAALVKEATGAEFVAAFDHNLRSKAGFAENRKNESGSPVHAPVSFVHGDYTLTSGPRRMELLGDAPKVNDVLKAAPVLSAELLEKARRGRFALVNVWRNIRSEPVEDVPLACLDASTLPAEDLCVFEIHYADRIGENYFAAHSPQHRWYYYPRMTRDEALLIKQWDSDGTLSGGPRAPFALHAAFLDPSAPEDPVDRESIEVRCICVFGDDGSTDEDERTAPASSLWDEAIASGLVSCELLYDHLTRMQRLGDGVPPLRLVDATYFLPNTPFAPPAGYEGPAPAFAKAPRLPGAVFFDLDAVAEPHPDGLKHMLPQEDVFAHAMAALRIDAGTTLVVYDRHGMFSAPRAWYTFKHAFGHAAGVAVLDGGLPRWMRLGLPVEAGDVAEADAPLDAPEQSWKRDPAVVRDVDEVKASLERPDVVVVDARASGRFLGTAPEPRPGCRGGHMPGSKNVPFNALLVGPGGGPGTERMRSSAEIRGIMSESGVDVEALRSGDHQAVLSCGSGLTACVVGLALHRVGVLAPKWAVYDGSWAEWGCRADTPIVRQGPDGDEEPVP